MSRLGAFGLAAVALAACGSQPAGPLPSGTYRYESREGKLTLNSTVTVSRNGGAIVINEEVQFPQPLVTPVAIVTKLNPTTYSVESMVVSNDVEGVNPSIAIAQSGATYVLDGSTSAATPAVAGAPSFVDANWASSYAPIPAIIHATGAKTLNMYLPQTFRKNAHALPLYVLASQAARPDGVPASDLSEGFAGTKHTVFITLWYDPSTYVLDAVQFQNATAFLRKP